MSSHRSIIKRKALMWQGATVLLALGAVSLFVLPIGNLIRPASANWDPAAPKPAGAGDAAGSSAMLSYAEAGSIGDILLSLQPPKGETAPPEIIEPTDDAIAGFENAEPVEPITPPAPAAAARANWVYLGSAITPRASRALVRIDQSQKFIRQGTELDGVKLVEVHDDHILIEESGQQRRVERAPLIATAMLTPGRPPGSAAPAGGAAGKFNGAGPNQPNANPSAAAAAALAAAQGAHGRQKTGGPNAPGALVARVNQLSPEQRAQAYTTMTNPLASDEEKIKVISELGFDPGGLIEARLEAARALGLNPDDPDVRRILEQEMNGAARDQR